MFNKLKKTKELRRGENKGITLIALIVTIIVLLILSGISISMLTGDNGILNQATNAKTKTEQAQEDEEKILGNYEGIIEEYANPEAKSMKIVVNSGEDKKVTLPIIERADNNYTINWGDGTTAKTNAEEVKEKVKLATTEPIKIALARPSIEETATHIYPEKNTEYTVTITGVMKDFRTVDYQSTDSKIIKIEQWGETGLIYIELRGCNNLTEIASPITNSFKDVTNFDYCFAETGITSIPENLFANCPNAKVFFACFGETGITSIPENLFANCPNATDFSYCLAFTGITSIPENLFANCPNATNFYACFANTGITSIPENLFKNCSKASNFNQTFYNCTQLTNYLSLWEGAYYNVENNNVSETTAGQGCYASCLSIQNRENIPDYWKEEGEPQ